MSLNSAKRLYKQGQQKLGAGDLERAIAKFRQSLRFQNNYYPALLAIGNALRDRGDAESAAQYFEKATKLRPDDARTYHRLDSVLWQIKQASKLDLKYAHAHCGHGHKLWKSNKYEEATESYQRTIRLYPDYYWAHNGLGNALKDIGKYEQSVQAYERAIELNPNLPDAYNGIGNSLRELGKYEEAIESYQKTLSIDPNYYNAHNGLGNVFYDIEKYQESIYAYENAIQINPSYYLSYNGYGNTLWKLKRYEEAAKIYKEAIKLYPNYANAHSRCGDALWKLERYEEAVNSYQTAIKLDPNYYSAHNGLGNALKDSKEYESAVKAYQKAIEINPNLAHAHNGLGNALKELARYEEAIDSYRQAIDIDIDYYYAYNGLGNALLSLRKYEEAVESYAQAIKINPEYAIAYSGCGDAFWNLERYEEALDSYTHAIKLNSSYYRAHSGLGNTLWKLKNYREAIESYQKSIQINSNYYWAYNGLGNALLGLSKYEDAVNIYQQAININPNYAHAHSGLGDALYRLKRYEEAIASYQKTIRIDPTYYWAYNGLGHVFTILSRHEDALTSYQEATRIDPSLPQAYDGIGNILRELKRFDEALESYKKAVEIQPTRCNAHNGLGNLSYKLRDYQKSISSYEKAIELHPECHNPWKGKGQAIWELHGIEQAIQFCDESIAELQKKGEAFKRVTGHLYLLKADAHYKQRKGRYRYSRICLNQAASAYLIAIKIFDEISDREPYLETSQKAIKVLLSLQRVDEADDLLQKGTEQLDRWLEEIPSPAYKKTIALKFSDFNQLTVDRHIQIASQLQDDRAIQTQHAIALETAEKGKNTCLSWLLYATDQPTNPSYADMQKLLVPGRAIAYWHLSPAALTTFILKPGAPAPIVITQPKTGDRPPSLQQLLDLEAWIKDWDDQYADYRCKDRKAPSPDHSWRKDMGQRLFDRQDQPGNLKAILNITAIESHLDDIDHLILVPHRDLHRFPLHALFDSRFVVTYLPSLQVGLARLDWEPTHPGSILSIGNPTNHPDTNHPSDLRSAFLEAQMIRQYFWQGRSLTETAATYSQIKDAIDAIDEKYTVLHFSGHGDHQFDNPKQSALLLAQDEKTEEARHLTLEDICQQDFTSYDLVSLSACETAIATNQSITTEYVGLVSGFLSQGAAQVISTLWVVQSEACAVIMLEFYRARQLGNGSQLTKPSDAQLLADTIQWFRHLDGDRFKQWRKDRRLYLSSLPSEDSQDALRQVLDRKLRWVNIEPEVQSPYTWAAFTLSGGFF